MRITNRDLALITTVPVHATNLAKTVYTQWRYRTQIEHNYPVDQENQLDVKEIQAQTLERTTRVSPLS